MTQGILLGNLCSLGAMISDSVSGTRKKHSEIMAIQIISQLFYGASAFFLKGYSAMAQNIVAIFRNLAAMKESKSKIIEYMLILAGVVLGAVINNRGLIGWLPILANFEYSVAVFRFKDNERALKYAFTASSFMFAVFSFVILNYVGVVTNSIVAVTTAVSLIKEHIDNRREKQEE